MQGLIEKVKEKREFSELPESIIRRALELNNSEIKQTRAFLRKYFGVFLTNKILKGKGNSEEVLGNHISSKKRDYEKLYLEFFSGVDDVGSIIDLGCGVNGFSYPYLGLFFENVRYVGVEASGQIVRNTNSFFREKSFENAKVLCHDLFDRDFIKDLLIREVNFKPRVVFLFQVVDALENFEKDFSKKFILDLSKNCERIILSFPLNSISGKNKFSVKRKWLIDFLNEKFIVEKDFEIFGERFFLIKC